MRTSQTLRTALLLALGTAIAPAACGGDSEPADGAESDDTCRGGKCDDIDPADFACKSLENKTQRSSDNILSELHDPFAHQVLKLGEAGCPSTREQVMERLRATDTEGCEEVKDGLRTMVVSETGQLEPDATNSFRTVTTRRCGDRAQHELVFSVFGAREAGLPQSVEVMAFDEETKEFNYYTVEGGAVAFHGSSTDLLKGEGGRCQQCHTGGGFVMKELRNPWIHWEGPASTPGARALVDAHDDFGSKSGGSSMESLTKQANNAWNETRVGLMTDRTSGFEPSDMLKPLFCGSEFNLDSAGLNTSGIRSLPKNLFTHCMLSETSCEGSHFGESGGVDIDKAIYAEAIAEAGSRVPSTSADDTILALTFIEPSVSDIDYIGRLMDAGAVDQDFVRDVLSIDFTRPVFSEERCELLAFAPTWAQVDGGDAAPPADGGGEGAVSNCCEDRSDVMETGCEDETVQECVCAEDDFCCNTSWDNICADIAQGDACNAVCTAAEPEPEPEPEGESEGESGEGEGEDEVDTAAAIKAAFIANIEASNPAEGSEAAQLLAALQTADDASAHADSVKTFLDACRGRDARAMIDDVLHYVNATVTEARSEHVMEFPATTQTYGLDSASDAHLDPTTCELVE